MQKKRFLSFFFVVHEKLHPFYAKKKKNKLVMQTGVGCLRFNFPSLQAKNKKPVVNVLGWASGGSS